MKINKYKDSVSPANSYLKKEEKYEKVKRGLQSSVFSKAHTLRRNFSIIAIIAILGLVLSACRSPAGPDTNDYDNGIVNGGDNGTGVAPVCTHDWSDWERVGIHPSLVTVRTCIVDGCDVTQTFTPGSGHVLPSLIVPGTHFNKEMVRIPAGSIMGGQHGTTHIIHANDFWMSRHQITRAQWYKVMETSPWGEAAADNRAVTHVRWFEALMFANELSLARGLTPVYEIPAAVGEEFTIYPDLWGPVPTTSTGAILTRWNRVRINEAADGYRLPSFYEWEYAARAGTTTAFNDGVTYGWEREDHLLAIDDLAWTNRNAEGAVHEVGQLRPKNRN